MFVQNDHKVSKITFQPLALPGGSGAVGLFSGEYHCDTSSLGDPPAKPGAAIATLQSLPCTCYRTDKEQIDAADTS